MNETPGLSFACLGGLGNGGWRGVLRVAQRESPLPGEGLCKLGLGRPAKAGVGAFGVIVFAQRLPAWRGHGAETGTGSLSTLHRANDGFCPEPNAALVSRSGTSEMRSFILQEFCEAHEWQQWGSCAKERRLYVNVC